MFSRCSPRRRCLEHLLLLALVQVLLTAAALKVLTWEPPGEEGALPGPSPFEAELDASRRFKTRRFVARGDRWGALSSERKVGVNLGPADHDLPHVLHF